MPTERSVREASSVAAICPADRFPRVLDLCCGSGRHCRAFAALGYEVTGVERDEAEVESARRLGGGPQYHAMDVREFALPASTPPFDLVVILGQSFGYFDSSANMALLVRLAGSLRAGGCLLLDLWNPDFFESRQGVRELVMGAGRVMETKSMTEDRLFVKLDYPDGTGDFFEWQVFSETSMAAFARRAGLELRMSFSDFDPALRPDPDKPKIQFLLKRAETGRDRHDGGRPGPLARVPKQGMSLGMNVFTYGSLMFPEVWERVTGSGLRGEPARLHGFEARVIDGQSYPALVPKPGGVTDGVVYLEVGSVEVERLDGFEGDFYERLEVEVEAAMAGAEGKYTSVKAEVYAAAVPEDPRILDERWRPEVFRDRHLAVFLREDPGFTGDR